MGYKWKKAIVNALLVFIGCFLAKIPAGDTIAVSWAELKHALAFCGTITLFAELRYIYKALQDWTNGNGGGKADVSFLAPTGVKLK